MWEAKLDGVGGTAVLDIDSGTIAVGQFKSLPNIGKRHLITTFGAFLAFGDGI